MRYSKKGSRDSCSHYVHVAIVAVSTGVCGASFVYGYSLVFQLSCNSHHSLHKFGYIRIHIKYFLNVDTISSCFPTDHFGSRFIDWIVSPRVSVFNE